MTFKRKQLAEGEEPKKNRGNAHTFEGKRTGRPAASRNRPKLLKHLHWAYDNLHAEEPDDAKAAQLLPRPPHPGALSIWHEARRDRARFLERLMRAERERQVELTRILKEAEGEEEGASVVTGLIDQLISEYEAQAAKEKA